VREILHTLPPKAQQAIREDLENTGGGSQARDYPDESTDGSTDGSTTPQRHQEYDAPTASIPVAREG
jgi:phospholipid/cholesterol/gamma-HCH transport system ATP-binding protein